MHHALLFHDILGVGRHIDYNRIVLWKTSFKVSLLPLELFVFAIWYGHSVLSVSINIRASILVPSREAKKLQMHVFDEVELSILWLVVDLLRVVIVFH